MADPLSAGILISDYYAFYQFLKSLKSFCDYSPQWAKMQFTSENFITRKNQVRNYVLSISIPQGMMISSDSLYSADARDVHLTASPKQHHAIRVSDIVCQLIKVGRWQWFLGHCLVDRSVLKWLFLDLNGLYWCYCFWHFCIVAAFWQERDVQLFTFEGCCVIYIAFTA